MTHLLNKHLRFRHLPNVRYAQNEKMLQTFWYPWKMTREIEKIIHDSVVTGAHP